jgi:hypothetical protein
MMCALCDGKTLPGTPICGVCLARIVWVPKSLDAALERWCRESGLSRQESIEVALREMLRLREGRGDQ